MARVDKGNALTTAQLQPGWTYQDDGYGLQSGKAVFIVNNGNETGAINMGQAHPRVPQLLVQKIQYTYKKNGIVELDVDYVGLSPSINQGQQTIPNVVPSGSLSTEHITTNKNFFSSNSEKAIAGNGTTFTASSVVPGTFVGGDYGAHFETVQGGAFLGFKDPSTNKKKAFFGKTSYLSPTASFNGVVYVTQQNLVLKVIDAVGSRNMKGNFGGVKMFNDYLDARDWQSADPKYDQLLLTSVNVEDFCIGADRTPKIYKITYEIRYSRDGYPDPVYDKADA